MTVFPSFGICIIISSVAFSSLVQREAPISNIHVLPASLILPSLTASTFQPENTLPSASLPVHPTSPSNASSKDINPLNATEVECDAEVGQHLTVASCQEAQSQLIEWMAGLQTTSISIGPLDWGMNFAIYEHSRFLSSNRVCAFDLHVADHEESHVERDEVANASNSLMSNCVNRAGFPKGGRIEGLSPERNVALDVLGNDRFPNLQCLRAPPAGPPVASCFALRNKVPKSESRQVFGRDGRQGRPDEDPDEYVPYTLVGGDGRCTLTITLNTPNIQVVDMLSWWEIYRAATEIEASCVRQGRGGRIDGLGFYGYLSVMLSDSAQPPPDLATNSSMNYTSSL